MSCGTGRVAEESLEEPEVKADKVESVAARADISMEICKEGKGKANSKNVQYNGE